MIRAGLILMLLGVACRQDPLVSSPAPPSPATSPAPGEPDPNEPAPDDPGQEQHCDSARDGGPCEGHGDRAGGLRLRCGCLQLTVVPGGGEAEDQIVFELAWPKP